MLGLEELLNRMLAAASRRTEAEEAGGNGNPPPAAPAASAPAADAFVTEAALRAPSVAHAPSDRVPAARLAASGASGSPAPLRRT